MGMKRAKTMVFYEISWGYILWGYSLVM